MSSETSASTSGKRGRDPEDDVYVDNLHSHKRYLSEIMASSLNGLTVGESLSENLLESPARSEGMSYASLWPCVMCPICRQCSISRESLLIAKRR